jgi:hypothetical protein
MVGARYLTKRHLHALGFKPDPKNCHLTFLFGVPLRSASHTASKLGGMKDPESKESIQSLESRKDDEESNTVYPSTNG